MTKPIKIVHIYPKEMNIYGDNGNILVLLKRLSWRGINDAIVNVGVGDNIPTDSDIIIGGGGQDAGQTIIADDLKTKLNTLKSMANNGVPMLMICGMYQMFGHYFMTQQEEKLPGIALLDIYTVAQKGRLIGNISTDTKWGKVIGYENHSGRTYLNANTKAFGYSKKGQGNNGKDHTEGAVYKNVFGTYLHGPILAKSVEFTDYLLRLAICNAGLNIELESLDNDLEFQTAKVAQNRPK